MWLILITALLRRAELKARTGRSRPTEAALITRYCMQPWISFLRVPVSYPHQLLEWEWQHLPQHTHTHTNSGNRKVTATINTPLCSPGSASVLQTNQVAWIGGGRNRRKKKALSMIYGAHSASAPPLSSFFDISLKPPHRLRDLLTCLGQGLIVCLGKSAATCFLSGFTLIAFWSYTVEADSEIFAVHFTGVTDAARPLCSHTGTKYLLHIPNACCSFFLLY